MLKLDSKIPIGKKFKVLEIKNDPLGERLKEIGFYPGVIASFIRKAPFSSAYIYQIDATTIALRPEEAVCIQVELLP